MPLDQLAMAFATIVSLTADFVSSRRADEAQTIDEYVDWLRRHEHKELADAIANNAELSRSLQTLLAEQHDAVMQKLANLDSVLTSVAKHMSGFTDIANAVRADSDLSEQAVSLLEQFNANKASRVLEIGTRGGTIFQFMDGDGGKLAIEDGRFIEDDLNTLCCLGLLMPSSSNKGARIFVITRSGAKVGGESE